MVRIAVRNGRVQPGYEGRPMAALEGLATRGHETRAKPAARPPQSSRGAMDWGDVRVFLAIARQGSMRGAGRALGLSQPTIARRLAAFEAGFTGQPLFDRLPDGLHLNAVGDQLLAAAEDAERAMLTFERRRAAASPMLSGTVRIATGECAAGFLARCQSGGTTTPLPSGITLELLQSLPPANLTRREADMSLRHQPPESGDYSPNSAPSASRFTSAVATTPMRGLPIPKSSRRGSRTSPRAGSSDRWKIRRAWWSCAPHRC